MFRRMQRVLCAILVVLLATAMFCPALAKGVQARVKASVAGLYSHATTASACVPIKKGTKLTVSAVRKGWAKVSCKGVTGYMKTSTLARISRKVSPSAWKSKVKLMSWSSGSKLLKKGKYAYIYDIKSGLTIKIKRMGGHNHFDVEPATKADTAKLKSLGGGYSWDSRPVILSAGGKFVAAAINTMPHGEQTLKNNGYNGQFCMHLLGSKTHGSGKVNEEHQKSIKKAYNWAH